MWHPMSSAPLDGTVVMLWQDGVARNWQGDWPYTPRFAAYDKDAGVWFNYDGQRVKSPTWWQPRPLPPTASKD